MAFGGDFVVGDLFVVVGASIVRGFIVVVGDSVVVDFVVGDFVVRDFVRTLLAPWAL